MQIDLQCWFYSSIPIQHTENSQEPELQLYILQNKTTNMSILRRRKTKDCLLHRMRFGKHGTIDSQVRTGWPVHSERNFIIQKHTPNLQIHSFIDVMP